MDSDIKQVLFTLGIATSIGALTGLGLSFTTLSPLVMGGIVAVIPAALLICMMTYNKGFSKRNFFRSSYLCAAVVATGVGFAAAATAIFPGVMLGMGSAALAGALIAPIAVIAGMLVTFSIIEPIAEKVNEYIISPIVEHFPSKGEKCNLPAK